METNMNEMETGVNKVVVWLMRHDPEEAVIKYFGDRGLEVVTLGRYIEKAKKDGSAFSFESGKQAAELADEIAKYFGGKAIAIVGIIPMPMIPEFLRNTSAPLVRAVMEVVQRDPDSAGGKAEYRWSGKFEKIIKVEIVTEEWTI